MSTHTHKKNAPRSITIAATTGDGTSRVVTSTRTPWDANLTVGASNLMNSGMDASGSVENQPTDPLESVYGRIPYVRYKQDL